VGGRSETAQNGHYVCAPLPFPTRSLICMSHPLLALVYKHAIPCNVTDSPQHLLPAPKLLLPDAPLHARAQYPCGLPTTLELHFGMRSKKRQLADLVLGPPRNKRGIQISKPLTGN
jgi:hypothetical protein